MILSDDEIKGLVFFDGKAAIYRSIETICNSHLEANARIRELEAQVQEWHERYVICCEDSRLEKEALRNELIEANANIDRWFRDHQKLSEAFIRQCDRADRLAVIADALAVELEAYRPQPCSYWDDIERYYDENNDDEGVYLPSPGDD